MSSVEASVTKRKRNNRLASDVIGQLEDKLEVDDLDIAVWVELLERIELKDKIEQVRSTYERFLAKFPFLSTQWIGYINYELNRGEFDKVEEIFKRCLLDVSSVDLWKTYINYVRRKNNLITGGEDARRVIFQAYDVAIDKVGIDPESSSLWDEYLKFIDDWKPISKWDEQQKMDMKRKVYKKALISPLTNLEKLWSDYTAFENDLNTTTARKFISEISGGYMNARSWVKEWSNSTKGLKRFISDDTSRQLKLWRNWIQWEIQNKLELDKSVLIDRISYIYKQAVQVLPFQPEIWFDYQQFYKDNELQAEDILHRSLLVNPTSFLLTFKLIETYEIDSNVAMAKKTYDSLIERLVSKHNSQSEEIDELKEELVGQVLAHKKSLQSEEDSEELKLSDEEKTTIWGSNQELQVKQSSLAKLSKTITLIYCQYLKTIKKLEGLKEARDIFKRARDKSLKHIITHHVYVEASYLEYYAERKTTVALKVFELGLKPSFFQNDGEYIYKYLKFLIKINQDTVLKSVFETTINTKKDLIESKWLKLIFKIYLKFETNFGKLSSILKIEKKYNEIFPNDSKILNFADRYSFNEFLIEEYQLEDDLIRFNDLQEEESDVANDRKRKSDVANGGGNKRQHIEEEQEEQITNEEIGQNNEELEELEVSGGKELVTDEIYNLLRVLPSAGNFPQPLFNSSKLIKLLQEQY